MTVIPEPSQVETHCFRVSFQRIGRNHIVPTLELTDVVSPKHLSELIYDYARPHLASRDVSVWLDMRDQHGGFACGFHSGGCFTFVETTPPAELMHADDPSPDVRPAVSL